jgi:urea transporter
MQEALVTADSDSLERARLPESVSQNWLIPLTGLGQIMFQNSALTGAFFLTGIAIVSPLVAAGAIVGSAVGTVTAHFLRYDRDEIRDGIYGFNSALVGIALLSHNQPYLLTLALALAGSIAATPLTQAMRQRLPVPSYTAPFIVTTWVAFYVAQELDIPVVVAPPVTAEQSLDVTVAVVRGLSEVMFQANVLTGALIFIGILLCSWKGAIWSIIGSLVGLLTGLSYHEPEATLSLGLYGYNAALTAMALALYRPSVLLPFVGAVMSVPFTEKLPLIGLPTLTTPFVIASWIVIAMDRLDMRLYGAQQDTKN